MGLKIDYEHCTLCGKCLEACPYEALNIVEDRLTVDERCTLCGACVEVCPVDVLSLRTEEPLPLRKDFDAYRGIWVFGEQREGRLHPVVFELLGAGAELAHKRNCALEVVVLGADLSGVPEQLRGCPAQTVHLVEHADLACFRAESYGAVLRQVLDEHKPEIVLAGATSLGRSLIPRVAVLLGTGLTADCTALNIDEETGELLQTRPAFGGNIMATIVCPRHRPQMATVRPKVMRPAAPKGERLPLVKRWTPPNQKPANPTQVLATAKQEGDGVDIAEAEVLVAGGRGVGGPEGFQLLTRLARELGGQVAASRVAVDSGWISYPHQVGQTGRTVQSKLYIACGISGSVQHRAGMQSAGTIVAVNTDPEAPIFEIADYGIVGDFAEVVPEIIRQLRKLKNRRNV